MTAPGPGAVNRSSDPRAGFALARVRADSDEHRVQILDAAPHALISVGLLADARAGRTAPWLTVEQTARGTVLTFTDDDGRRFLYRLGRYQPGTGCHAMDWPD